MEAQFIYLSVSQPSTFLRGFIPGSLAQPQKHTLTQTPRALPQRHLHSYTTGYNSHGPERVIFSLLWQIGVAQSPEPVDFELVIK